ncbi:MAG: helix-turn-helix domain-containing protein [Clostridia bacterium]|nr:helix-turn-helix domain-containing protein [Clostridia bacterium]MBO7296414.1 helix-turn-helix domain-containing protein [Clostridia bacterium]
MPALCLCGKDYLYLGYPLHLTPAEFEILHALTNKDAFVAKENAPSVAVHVCAINKRARMIGGRRLICLARGTGYVLDKDI